MKKWAFQNKTLFFLLSNMGLNGTTWRLELISSEHWRNCSCFAHFIWFYFSQGTTWFSQSVSWGQMSVHPDEIALLESNESEFSGSEMVGINQTYCFWAGWAGLLSQSYHALRVHSSTASLNIWMWLWKSTGRHSESSLNLLTSPKDLIKTWTAALNTRLKKKLT